MNAGNPRPDPFHEDEPVAFPPPVPLPVLDWRALTRRLLVCNPFFLCSAALLLFGLNRLSLDPDFLGGEEAKLFFNFSALQFYEVLVVVAAIVLMRRSVWYDSALLVVMDAGLMLVPFILISHGVMIDRGLGRTLAISAALLAVARLAAIRRWYPMFNLPTRLLVLGVVVLLANILLPLRVHAVVDATTTYDWDGPNRVIWLGLLPLLAAGANLLPRPRRYGGLNPERHWLPLFLFTLWICGTAVHAWSCAYVCKQPLTWPLLAPLLFVATWTVWNRLSDFVPEPSTEWRRAALVPTLAVPLLALGDARVFASLMALNCVAYAVLWVRLPELRRTLASCAGAAFFLLLVGMPTRWVETIPGGAPRGTWIALLFGGGIVAAALRVFRPQFGLAAGLCVGFGTAWFNPADEPHLAVQTGLLAALLHSLLWDDALAARTRHLRLLLLVCWLVDAVWWTGSGALLPLLATSGGGLVVAAAWWVQWRRLAERFLPLVPATALLVMLSSPGNWIVRHGADGMLALLGSLLLFAIGCALAWTRNRWERRPDKE